VGKNFHRRHRHQGRRTHSKKGMAVVKPDGIVPTRPFDLRTSDLWGYSTERRKETRVKYLSQDCTYGPPNTERWVVGVMRE
jgi:hypothetical protein